MAAAAAAAAEGRKAWRAAASAFSTCLLLPVRVRHSDLFDLIHLQLLPIIATCAIFRLSGIEV